MNALKLLRSRIRHVPGLNWLALIRVIAIPIPSINASKTPPMIADVKAACGPPEIRRLARDVILLQQHLHLESRDLITSHRENSTGGSSTDDRVPIVLLVAQVDHRAVTGREGQPPDSEVT